jgi:hypothetical protein
MRSAPVIVLLLLATIVVGCGGGSSGGGDDGDNSALKYQGQERAAAQTIEDFATAIRGDDWKRICQDLFSDKQRELTAGIVSGSCEKEIDRYSDLDRLRLTVTSVSLDNSARVDTTTASGGDATFDLKQEGGAWKIDGTSGDFTAGGEPSGDTPSGSGDQAAVEQVVLDYDRARADEDWAALCGLLTESRRQFAGSDCEANAPDEHGGGALGLTITSVEVKREAGVGVRTGKGDGAHFTLVPEGERWKIDSYGGTFGNG